MLFQLDSSLPESEKIDMLVLQINRLNGIVDRLIEEIRMNEEERKKSHPLEGSPSNKMRMSLAEFTNLKTITNGKRIIYYDKNDDEFKKIDSSGNITPL